MKFTISAILLLLQTSMFAQSEIEPNISFFKEVVVSEGIDLVLEQGDRPGLKIAYVGVKPEALTIENEQQKLSISLKGCPDKCPEEELKVYQNSQIIAYVTYTSLSKLVIYGNNEVIGLSPISSGKFVLESFGENRISFREVTARKFHLTLYGENHFTVKKGTVATLRVKEYGDNQINARNIIADDVKVVPWVTVEGATRNPEELSGYH